MALVPFVQDLTEIENEAHRDLYVETDGGYLLDTDVTQHPATRALRNALGVVKEKEKKAKAELDKFQGVDLGRWETLSGVDEEGLLEFQAWQEQNAGRTTGDKNSGGDDFEQRVARATAKMRGDHKRETEARDARINEMSTHAETLSSDLRKFKINQQILDTATRKGAKNPKLDILPRAIQVWRMDETGEPAAFDESGDPILDKNMKKITMDEWVDHIAQESRYLFKESVGGGVQGTQAGIPGNIMPRSKAGLTTSQKVEFISEYGLEKFEELPALDEK